MSKRKFLVLLTVGLLVACPTVWLFFSLVGGKTDAEKYRSLQRLYNLGFRARCAELSRLGAPLRRFRLADRCYDRFNVQRDELLASGYLTNISVELSNAAGRKAYVLKQLSGIERSTDALICGLVLSSNSLVITCRPQDAGRFRQALAP
jgi:hypothetical protein